VEKAKERPAPSETDFQKELEDLQGSWAEIVEHCLSVQPALRKDLRDSWPVSVMENTLTIGFDPEFAAEVEEVSMLDHGVLKNFFSRKLGRQIQVKHTVLERPVTWSHEKVGPQPESGTESKDWTDNPAIRSVLEVFHGDVIEIQR